MACNCGKKKLATQPKKIVKTNNTPKNSGTPNRRIIRRVAR